MALEDIPVRDGDDGATQLALLRSYLKDTDSDNYRIPDVLLIANLEQNDVVVSWRTLVGATEEDIPWSYDISDPTSHITIIRSMTDDTDPNALKYTDYELLQYLEFLPLRYLITSLKANVEDTATYPIDPRDPIRIMRDLLDDQEGSDYSDHDLIQRMLDHKQDPYSVVISMIKCEGGIQAADEAKNFGNSLASIDGISFQAETGSSGQETSDNNLAIIAREFESSIYQRELPYNWYVDSEPVSTSEFDWYGI